MANNLFSDDFNSSEPELKLALGYFWFMHMNSTFWSEELNCLIMKIVLIWNMKKREDQISNSIVCISLPENAKIGFALLLEVAHEEWSSVEALSV